MRRLSNECSAAVWSEYVKVGNWGMLQLDLILPFGPTFRVHASHAVLGRRVDAKSGGNRSGTVHSLSSNREQ